MRPKKDPGVRQEAFIHAATELFMEKGFEAVSVRDVLDAVADKTASPSVFYYYFPSKDALYRSCVNAVAENYLAAIGEGISMEGKSMEEWMLSLVSCMEQYLLQERNLMLTGSSTPNRLFILDMREQVTAKSILLWTDSLSASFGIPQENAKELAQFICGGIGEMIFTFMLEGNRDRQAMQRMTESMVSFCMNTLGLKEQQKMHLLHKLNEVHTAAAH